MDNEALTSEDLVWIEAELRSQAFHPGYSLNDERPFPFACKDCRQRIALADKIKQTRGGLPLSEGFVRRKHNGMLSPTEED